jgi:hypothetical protein
MPWAWCPHHRVMGSATVHPPEVATARTFGAACMAIAVVGEPTVRTELAHNTAWRGVLSEGALCTLSSHDHVMWLCCY